MKNKILAAFIGVLLIGGAVFYEETRTPETLIASETSVAPEDHHAPFPNVLFKTPDGKSIGLQDIKEPIILVHFWAAWCAVCHTEFPELLKYVENAHGKIALLSISMDDRYEDSQKTLDTVQKKYQLSLKHPHLYWAWDQDKNLSVHIFNTVKVPETIVVQNGMMIDKIIGVGPWADATKKP